MSDKVVRLDVREDIRKGREPFSRIMQAVGSLGADGQLELIAPFEPAPLYGVLGQQGFSHTATPLEGGDWKVLFLRGGSTAPEAGPAAAARGSAACQGTPVLEVDARGLEPPQPLVKILEAVSTLPEGAELRARTDRRPMHLYAQLEERGFRGESQEQADGSFLTYVRRR